MKKLKKKHVAGYLPYGLRCLNCDGMIEKIEFDNIGSLMRGIDLQDEAKDDAWAGSQQYKPILRPISDMYRPIRHNGEEIVPIVEVMKRLRLFRTVKRSGEDILPIGEVINTPLKKYDEIGAEEDYGLIRAEGKLYKFEYDIEFEAFTATDVYGNHAIPGHQHKLFDYLHALKIDYRGLIAAGLAVDANTLKNNPYK